MSFMPRKASVYSQGLQTANRGYNAKHRDYGSLSTATRRHEYVAGAPDVVGAGGMGAIAFNEYFLVTLCAFKRSFGAGADDLPTATAGNNYQSPRVMNGSYVNNMNSTITLKNQASTNPATLTIYEMAYSFYDALDWNALDSTVSPVQMGVGTANSGDVELKSPATATRLLENTIKNSRFRQRYMRKVGTVTFGNSDQASSTAVFTINKIPPKCRRSQIGMYFGYAFVNDSDKNNGGSLNFEYSLENNFTEYPTDNRLPFLA